jgi:hypothetical protein
MSAPILIVTVVPRWVTVRCQAVVTKHFADFGELVALGDFETDEVNDFL